MPDPVAIQIGNLSIRWYGIMVALGFLAAFKMAQYRAKKVGLPQDAAPDLTFAAMIGGIAGARVLYVIQNWRTEFADQLLDIFKVWHGGLVFYGGFIGALVLVILWSLHRRLSLRDVGDVAAPALPLGHAIGRIGCFLNGCCFGRPWDGFPAVTYPGITSDGMINGPLYVQRRLGIVEETARQCQPVFPIQLVAAAVNGFICLALIKLGQRPGWRGRLFPLYLVLYATTRFIVEWGRGDYPSRTLGLTPAQMLCLVLLPVGLGWLLWNPGTKPPLKDGETETPDI